MIDRVFRQEVQTAATEAYDRAEEALRLAEDHAPDVASYLRLAVDHLFTVRTKLDEDE